MHAALSSEVAEAEVLGSLRINTAAAEVRVPIIDLLQLEAERFVRLSHFVVRSCFGTLLGTTHRRLVYRRDFRRRQCKPRLQFQRRVAHTAIVHGRHEVKHIAFRTTRKTMECILLSADMKCVDPLAAMNRAGTAEFAITSAKCDTIMFKHLLNCD